MTQVDMYLSALASSHKSTFMAVHCALIIN
jgi:hypothetical protein